MNAAVCEQVEPNNNRSVFVMSGCGNVAEIENCQSLENMDIPMVLDVIYQVTLVIRWIDTQL